jgi:hypothetical protein
MFRFIFNNGLFFFTEGVVLAMPSPFFRLVLCARVGVDAAGLGHRWMLCGYTNLLLKNNTVEWLTRVNSRCGLVLVVWACVIAQRSQALPRLWGSEHQPSGSEVSMGGGHWTDGRAFSVPFHAVAARLCASCGGSATLQGDWRHLPARYHCLYGTAVPPDRPYNMRLRFRSLTTPSFPCQNVRRYGMCVS